MLRYLLVHSVNEKMANEGRLRLTNGIAKTAVGGFYCRIEASVICQVRKQMKHGASSNRELVRLMVASSPPQYHMRQHADAATTAFTTVFQNKRATERKSCCLYLGPPLKPGANAINLFAVEHAGHSTPPAVSLENCINDAPIVLP